MHRVPAATMLTLVACLFTLAGCRADAAHAPRQEPGKSAAILEPPVVKLPPGERPVVLSRMTVDVTVSGLESETVTSMTFRNPNQRQLAGDLEFPLPDGAVVSGYALDVRGRMVDGVGVTKRKARVVLETEMRRRVDPGLVEHVRGNLFRTRIFPLPAGGERTVRVTTVAPLTLSGGDAACHVPLPRVAIPSLTLRVEVAKGPVRPDLGGFGNLRFTEWTDRWTAETSIRDATPGDDLYVRLPRLPDLLVAVEELGGDRFVSISHAPTLPASAAAPTVRRAAIAWDASGSRSPDAIRRDRAMLSALLAAPGWRAATVDIVVFRDRPEPARTFVVRDGASPDLLAHIDSLPYDGGTDLAALDMRKGSAPHPADEAWLLFTDGLYTLGATTPKVGGLPVHVIASDSVRDAPLQRFLAAATGGVNADLALVEPEAAARLLAQPPITLLRVDAPAGTLADVQYRFTPGSGRASVYARLAGKGEAALVYGSAGRELLRVPVPLTASAVRPGRVLARAWASRVVEELAVFPDRNEAAMADLGRRFGLVTPVTSLIVLEDVRQYVEHQIEPPESWPEMRQQYLAALESRKGIERQRASSKIDRVLSWWRTRTTWWEREHKYPDNFVWSGPTEEAAPRERRQRVAGGVEGGVPGGVVGGVVAPLPSAPPPPAPGRAAAEAQSAAFRSKLEDASAGSGAAPAAISIKGWSPDTPYLKAIRSAPPRDAYRVYLQQRPAYAGSPSFYIDCGGALLGIDKPLGLRVLSNLAELRIDDAALLRVFAWRLAEAGELDRGIETLDRVRGLRPEDPQSQRDLALLLADRMDRDKRGADGIRALRLLNHVVTGEWSRFEEIEVIALMEINRLLARLERLDKKAFASIDFVDERLRRLLDLDVRIVMSWDADNTDIDLHVVEPSGEEAFYGHNQTTIGGHVSRDFTQGYGPEEYVLRRAMAGVYKIRCKYYGSSQQTLVGPATVSAVVITNFGRPDERRQTLTLRLENVKEMVDIGEVTIGGGAIAAAGARRPPAVTRAAIQALARGANRAEVERRLGPPERVEGSGITLLAYRTVEGSVVRLGFGPDLLWARETLAGAERELTLSDGPRPR